VKRHTYEVEDLRGMRLQVFFCVSFSGETRETCKKSETCKT